VEAYKNGIHDFFISEIFIPYISPQAITLEMLIAVTKFRCLRMVDIVHNEHPNLLVENFVLIPELSYVLVSSANDGNDETYLPNTCLSVIFVL
jgi:hypothetical protein